MDLAISLLALATALSTPLPRYFDLSPSRSSRASCSPVDAPEGTAARPSAPPSRITSASTVGFPRESMICLPCTRAIFVDMLPPGRLTARASSFEPRMNTDEKLMKGSPAQDVFHFQLLAFDSQLLPLIPALRSWILRAR